MNAKLGEGEGEFIIFIPHPHSHTKLNYFTLLSRQLFKLNSHHIYKKKNAHLP